ncbi:MAG: hypothetical protein AAGE89_13675 [Pseudomonadota bacterium]
MKMKITALTLVGLSISAFAIPAHAGFGGAAPLGQNPDQILTIAERQQLQRLRLKGKIKNIYQSDVNRLQAIEEDRWFLTREKRRKNRK